MLQPLFLCSGFGVVLRGETSDGIRLMLLRAILPTSCWVGMKNCSRQFFRASPEGERKEQMDCSFTSARSLLRQASGMMRVIKDGTNKH